MKFKGLQSVRKQLRECEKKGLCAVTWVNSHICDIVFEPNTRTKTFVDFNLHLRDHYNVFSISEFRSKFPPDNISRNLPQMVQKSDKDAIGLSIEFNTDPTFTRQFEQEIAADSAICQNVLNDDWARMFYQSITNMQWKKEDHVFAASFRYAAGLVAELRNKNEDYLHFYCSGAEGRISVQVEWHLNRLGWYAFPYKD